MPSASITSFMFGPQLSDRAGRITGFVHVLLGASRVSDGFNLGKGGVDVTAAHFSMVIGGGIDAHVTNIIAVRSFQAGYESIRVPNPVTGNQEARNNFRLSMGVVFKIK